MRQLKDSIEDAQQREMDALNAAKELDAKADIWEGEKTTLQSRINVVKTEYEKILKRLDESETKLDEAEAKTEISEKSRKLLAETEVDDFERHEEIESTLKAAAESKESADYLVVEAERKKIVLEQDLERMQEKHEKFAERCEELEKRLEESATEMRDLEEWDYDSSERENVSEEKIAFLEGQLREVRSTIEIHERDAAKLERSRDKLGDEIESWKEKREEVLQQLEEFGALINDDDD